MPIFPDQLKNGVGLSFFASDATGTTDVTTELKTLIEANPGRYIFIPPGTYRINNLDPNASVLLWAIPGTATLINDFNSPTIETNAQSTFVKANTVAADVTAVALATFDDGFAQTSNTDYVTKLTLGTGQGATFAGSVGDVCVIHSTDVHASGGNRNLGEAFKVLGVSGDDLFVDGVLAQTYTTGIRVNKYPLTRRFHLNGLRFSAPGNGWKDIATSITDASGGNALNIWNFPFATVENCSFEGLWAGGIVFRCCPLARVRNCDMKNLSNARTAIDNGRLGYGVSCYGHCFGTVVDGVRVEEGRHAVTTDGLGATYSVANWNKIGQPTFVEFKNVTAVNAWGIPFDTHEEGCFIIFDGCTAINPLRGPQGGSYAGFGMQLRAQNVRVRNYHQIGGTYGIRIPASECPNSTQIIESAVIERLRDATENGYAIRHEDVSGITNKPLVRIGRLTVTDSGRAIFANTGADITVDELAVSKCRARMVQVETGAKVLINRFLADFRENPTGAGTLNVVTMAGTSECRIVDLTVIQGDATTRPPRIFQNQDSATGKTVGLHRLAVIDPSAIGQLEIMNITAMSNFTWVGGGRTEIHVIDSDATTVVTGTARYSFVAMTDIAIRDIRATISTASSSGAVVVDVKRNGTSLFQTNKLTIDASGTNSAASATQPSWLSSSSRIRSGDVITVDVTSAGTGAKGLRIHLIGF